MRTRPRPRRYVVPWLFVFVRPLMTYSYWRQAYVLKLVGDRVGPVLRVDRRRRQVPLVIADRRRGAMPGF